MQVEPQKLLSQLQSALSLISLMPPSKAKKNMIGLIKIAPEIQDNLYQHISLPLQTHVSSEPYLLTQLNRDGDSYRSPFTNKYQPQQPENAYYPSEKFREMEKTGNLLFTEYTKLYYGHQGIGAFYVMENDQQDNIFTCGYFAKKICPIDSSEQGFQGEWNSYNVVDVTVNATTATYKLNTTVMLEMNVAKENNGNLDLSGFMKNSKTVQKSLGSVKAQQVMEWHLVTIGQLIETLQSSMRQQMQAVYIARTRQILFTTRYEQTKQIQNNKYRLTQQLKNIRFSQK